MIDPCQSAIHADPFGGPFNGQLGRKKLFQSLQKTFCFDAIVETGTLTGSTTEHFATFPVSAIKTFELNGEVATAARRRLAPWPHVEVITADSANALGRLAMLSNFPQANVFFYLDAHWGEKLPLVDEIKAIVRWWKDSIVMIDDFEVPFDAGYEFDDYGPGKRLCRELVEGLLPHGTPLYFPSLPSTAESGWRRGCAVFGTSEYASLRLSRVPGLRPATQ